MPRVRDLLYRFRPVGAPGAASAAAVPIDRSAELAAELEPLLARLADVERSCADIREQGRRDADAIRDRDAARARELLARAGREADAERVDAAAQVQRHAQQQTASDLTAAEEEAAEIRARAAERIPGHVEHITASVRELIDTGTPQTQRAGR